MRFASLTALTLVLALPAFAAAQEEVQAEARAAFEAGQAAYRAGRFPEALSYFQRAHELTGEPDLLFNIATVHDRLRHDREALEAYRGYLEARPDAEDRANIEARIAVLEEALAAQAQAPPDVTEPEPEPDIASEPEVAPEPEPEPPAASDPGPGPWIVTGAGAVLAAGGAALLIAAQLDIDAVAAGTSWAQIRDAYDRVPILSGTGFGLLGAGVAALAGGLIWAAVGSGGSTEVALGPSGVRVRGTF